jgi:L-ascorbate metabolism protein UlaG (beta-lactamase superfamily)
MKPTLKLALIVLTVIAVAIIVGWVAFAGPGQTNEPAPFIASGDARDPLPVGKTVEVQYIANEGVLITGGGKRVLIDGLHRKYADAYAYLPDAEREKIEAARVPFDAIDLVLVSHMHGDHFHPESVGNYLRSNSKAALATSHQIVDEIAGKFADYAAVKDRITPLTFTFKERFTRRLAGIDVEFLGLGHGSGRHATIQNFGHIFSVGGKRFLHIGDAPTSAELFDHFDLDKLSIDIAFMPAWFLTSNEGKAIIRDHIKPKHIIAVHVGPAEGESLKKAIAKDFPTADVFSTMLETRHF